jgi:type IV pilus assembly protein PilA
VQQCIRPDLTGDFMAIAKRMTKRGFTLIELMIVVVIIGILAALAIYGVSQYVTNAKTAEARTAVGRIGKDALSAFEAEQMTGSVMNLGSLRGVSRSLCASAGQVPAAMQAEGEKFQPAPSNFRDAATLGAGAGWSCLGFSMDQPINFQYDYNSNVTAGAQAAAGDEFLAFGQARMGGSIKMIALPGLVQTDGTAGTLVLTVAPALTETSDGTALAEGALRADLP